MLKKDFHAELIIYPRTGSRHAEKTEEDKKVDRLWARNWRGLTFRRPYYSDAVIIRTLCQEKVSLIIGSNAKKLMELLRVTGKPHKCLFALSGKGFLDDHMIRTSLSIQYPQIKRISAFLLISCNKLGVNEIFFLIV